MMRLGAMCAMPRFNLRAYLPRKRIIATFFMALLGTVVFLRASKQRFTREQLALLHLREQIAYIKSLYLAREHDMYQLQKYVYSNGSYARRVFREPSRRKFKPTLSPEVAALLKNCTGMKLKSGLDPKNLALIQLPEIHQLLPHLMKDLDSLRPAYHLKGDRRFVDYVIGVPTVKRDKESYLITTLYHLVNNLEGEERKFTAIVVFVGETDLTFVLETARKIETSFPQEISDGLIEVMSPRASFYPNLTTFVPTLGDSRKRFEWRTKQNLDTMFLMTYAQTKGTYYLMLEDDVLSKPGYMTVMKKFTSERTLEKSDWFIIEYCPDGGIAKLFRSRDLFRFLTYVELFYTNMPVDWLLDSFIADIVCTDAKYAEKCKNSKKEMRIQYKPPLFRHIGLYSSLKGKTHKVSREDTKYGTIPSFFPHVNPPLLQIVTDIKTYQLYTLHKAYEGQNFYWGMTRVKGDVIEFWFKEPTPIERYTFRSGNRDHPHDILRDAAIEVLPEKDLATNKFTQVGLFDEFGFAEGTISPELGPLVALRLNMLDKSDHWLILSEIDLQVRKTTSESTSRRYT